MRLVKIFYSIIVVSLVQLTSGDLRAQDFSQIKRIIAADGAVADGFGNSVSIDGNIAVVGAQLDDDNGDASGSVYIYQKDVGGDSNWGLIKKIIPSDSEPIDFFGASVSISGDILAVGAFSDDDVANQSGAAYIFYRNHGGMDQWGEVKKIVPFDGEENDSFGGRVTLDSNTLLVRSNNQSASIGGSVYVFDKDQGGTDNWGFVRKLNAPDGAAFDSFGWDIGFDGDHAVIGSRWDDDIGFNSGSAYIFYRNQGGPNNWGFVRKLIAFDGASNDWFGYGVDIDGSNAIIGAKFDDSQAGSVYVFSKDQGGTDNWGLVKKVVATDRASFDLFSESLCLEGERMIVSAMVDDDVLPGSGSIYVYEKDEGGINNWGEVQKFQADPPQSGVPNFGIAIECTGDLLVVGANRETGLAGLSGAAYIFSSICTSLPQADCNDITVYLDDQGQASITVDDINNASIAECGISDISLSQISFDCSHLGNQTVSLFIKDTNSAIDSCEAVVTVIDTISPLVVCGAYTLDLSRGGMTSINPIDISQSIMDNCLIDTQYLSSDLIDCNDLSIPMDRPLELRKITSFLAFSSGSVRGISADDQRIYVCDAFFNRVNVFDYQGNFTLVGSGGGESQDIAVDSSGNYYVLSYLQNKVDVHNLQGTLLYSFTDQLDRPVGIHIYNNKIYIANETNGNVTRHSLDGTFEMTVIQGEAGLNGIQISENKISTSGGTNKIWDLSGNLILDFQFSDSPGAGVFDSFGHFYMPRPGIADFSAHNAQNASEIFKTGDRTNDVEIVDNYLIALDFDTVKIFEILPPLDSLVIPKSITITVEDASGNTSSCESTILVTDTHGYCCPDALDVVYRPIDSTDYYAADSIYVGGIVSDSLPVILRTLQVTMDTLAVDQGGRLQVFIENCNN